MINQEHYKSKPGEKTGKKHWSVTTKVIWHDAEGKILGTVGISRDITEQKLTEAKLAYEQQLFQTLLEICRTIFISRIASPASCG